MLKMELPGKRTRVDVYIDVVLTEDMTQVEADDLQWHCLMGTVKSFHTESMLLKNKITRFLVL